MERKILYELKGLYRDNFRVTGFSFGSGEKTLCIIGNMRGNEYQQIFICSELVKWLTALEQEGTLLPGHEILVIPSANPYSMNIEKRFWPTDNTDINRMFPGYALGETTQRIAGGIFEAVTGYRYGIQLASFYMPGDFAPHVRIMDTGRDYLDKARAFNLPYIVKRTPRPYDTTTLNYNWQIWGTDAFSLYSTTTEHIDVAGAGQIVQAIRDFMVSAEIIKENPVQPVAARVIRDGDLVSVRPYRAGFFRSEIQVGERVKRDQVLAVITDPYDGTVHEKLISPTDGSVFFVHSHPMTYANTAVIKIAPGE